MTAWRGGGRLTEVPIISYGRQRGIIHEAFHRGQVVPVVPAPGGAQDADDCNGGCHNQDEESRGGFPRVSEFMNKVVRAFLYASAGRGRAALLSRIHTPCFRRISGCRIPPEAASSLATAEDVSASPADSNPSQDPQGCLPHVPMAYPTPPMPWSPCGGPPTLPGHQHASSLWICEARHGLRQRRAPG